jgi:hypothetical protein
MKRMRKLQFTLAVLAIACGTALAQQQTPLMGTVATHDALVTGGLEVQGERARLLTNASVTAYDHTASVALARGGEALVCATSQFHLLHSGTGNALLFGLDRGALELHTRSDAHDVILTPDIRFTLESPGDLDLRLRVGRNGDTCVDNAGKGSPVLLLNGAFNNASYRLMPGQHVLFEHGSLREVVDHERSPCGCPAAPSPLPANATAAQRAAAQHPFPEAASEGLAPIEPVDNNGPVGEKHTQISTTFSYEAGQGAPAGGSEPGSAGEAEQPHGFFHAIGHFFHRLFHSGS